MAHFKKIGVAILITALPFTSQVKAQAPTTNAGLDHFATQSPASVLASQVSDIALSPKLSQKEKAKYIANAVRIAITATTRDLKDSAQIVNIAIELATVATKAAPAFAQVISHTVSSLSAISSIEGAAGQIAAAVEAAALAATTVEIASPAASSPTPTNQEFSGSNSPEVLTVSRAH
jgi:hypothetical protein